MSKHKAKSALTHVRVVRPINLADASDPIGERHEPGELLEAGGIPTAVLEELVACGALEWTEDGPGASHGGPLSAPAGAAGDPGGGDG